MRCSVFLALLLVCGACPYGELNYPYNQEPDPRNKEIVLGVGDIVSINVWGEGNGGLNTEATIRPDGTITMPLIGDLKASGMTPSQLKQTIRTRLEDFVKLHGGEITVAVKEWRSYRFTVQGEVQKTGVYTSDEYLTVADALALAGGPTRFAKRSQIVLMRYDPKTNQTKRIPLDYEALASGKRLDMNIFVLPGDTIYVP
jgi:polysaccharide export outer membrane protein